jgi:hypothetical protein
MIIFFFRTYCFFLKELHVARVLFVVSDFHKMFGGRISSDTTPHDTMITHLKIKIYKSQMNLEQIYECSQDVCLHFLKFLEPNVKFKIEKRQIAL